MKTAQLQIRLTPDQKARLKRRAALAGQDLSSFVLSRVLPADTERLETVLSALREAETTDAFALAELHDLLAGLSAAEFVAALGLADLQGVSPLQANLVAAMVEHAAHAIDAPPPPWCAAVPPLTEPWFAAPLKRLRPYLLKVSPVAFRRRNLFVDSTIGDRA